MRACVPFYRRPAAACLSLAGALALLLNVVPVLSKPILVLLSDTSLETSHSIFLDDLRAAGLQLEVAHISNSSVRLLEWGEWLYDGAVILSDGPTELERAVSPAQLVELLEASGSLFVAAGPAAAPSVLTLCSDLGLDFLQPTVALTDHVSAVKGDSPQALITTRKADAPVIVGADPNPILYRGTAMTLAPDSILTVPILYPEDSATAALPSQALLGPDLVLAAATQTRTNARLIAVASTDMLSDAAFQATPSSLLNPSTHSSSGNRDFARSAAMWAFQKRGVLQMRNLVHRRPGEAGPPKDSMYTVNDTIVLQMELFENDGPDWLPHLSDSVQAELVMLDPYVRQTMTHDDEGSYSLTVHAPDVYGVFKWVIDYKRLGYTFLHVEEAAPLRPLRHNEYPRFLLHAYPYYACVATVSLAFWAMIVYVLYSS